MWQMERGHIGGSRKGKAELGQYVARSRQRTVRGWIGAAWDHIWAAGGAKMDQGSRGLGPQTDSLWDPACGPTVHYSSSPLGQKFVYHWSRCLGIDSWMLCIIVFPSTEVRLLSLQFSRSFSSLFLDTHNICSFPVMQDLTLLPELHKRTSQWLCNYFIQFLEHSRMNLILSY